MVSQTWDGKRVYFSSSLLANWDKARRRQRAVREGVHLGREEARAALRGRLHGREARPPAHHALRPGGLLGAQPRSRGGRVARALALAGALYLPPEPGSYELPPIARVSARELVDSSGARAPFPALAKGQVAVVAFVYKSCHDAEGCPAALAFLQELDRRLAADPAARRARAAGERQLRSRARHAREAGRAARADGAARRLALPRARERRRPGARCSRDFGQDVAVLESGAQRHVVKIFLVDDRLQVRNVYSSGFLDADLVLADVATVTVSRGSKVAARRSAVAVSICAISTHSSFVCACAIEPGPNTIPGQPRALNSPASVPNATLATSVASFSCASARLQRAHRRIVLGRGERGLLERAPLDRARRAGRPWRARPRARRARSCRPRRAGSGGRAGARRRRARCWSRCRRRSARPRAWPRPRCGSIARAELGAELLEREHRARERDHRALPARGLRAVRRDALGAQARVHDALVAGHAAQLGGLGGDHPVGPVAVQVREHVAHAGRAELLVRLADQDQVAAQRRRARAAARAPRPAPPYRSWCRTRRGPQMRPSATRGSNGSISIPSTGTVSRCDATRIVSRGVGDARLRHQRRPRRIADQLGVEPERAQLRAQVLGVAPLAHDRRVHVVAPHRVHRRESPRSRACSGRTRSRPVSAIAASSVADSRPARRA